MKKQTELRGSQQAFVSLALTCIVITACTASGGDHSEPTSSVTARPTVKDLAATSSGVSKVAPAELAKMRDYLANRIPAQAVVHTIVANSETFDCILADQQPSVRILRSQGIAVDVHAQPRGSGPTIPDNPAAHKASLAAIETCPAGTVSMRRIPLDELAAYGTLDGYLNRPPPRTNSHEHAGTGDSVPDAYTNYGASSVINTWNPYVASYYDFSDSQMWVQGGGYLEGGVLQSLEAGFVRWHGQNTRLFAFYTNNSYQPGSYCYNDDCGFVKTDPGHWFDWDWGAYSVGGGQQEEVEVTIIKDYRDGDWWLRVDSTYIGYWPQALFNSPGLYYAGSRFSFAGEVYQYSGPYHTTTAMGSGAFANAGYRYAAYQRFLQYAFAPYQWDWADTSDQPLTVLQESSINCYSASYVMSSDPIWGDYTYFGGPGYNPINCQY